MFGMVLNTIQVFLVILPVTGQPVAVTAQPVAVLV